jgi:hypothetical protein
MLAGVLQVVGSKASQAARIAEEARSLFQLHCSDPQYTTRYLHVHMCTCAIALAVTLISASVHLPRVVVLNIPHDVLGLLVVESDVGGGGGDHGFNANDRTTYNLTTPAPRTKM